MTNTRSALTFRMTLAIMIILGVLMVCVPLIQEYNGVIVMNEAMKHSRVNDRGGNVQL